MKLYGQPDFLREELLSHLDSLSLKRTDRGESAQNSFVEAVSLLKSMRPERLESLLRQSVAGIYPQTREHSEVLFRFLGLLNGMTEFDFADGKRPTSELLYSMAFDLKRPFRKTLPVATQALVDDIRMEAEGVWQPLPLWRRVTITWLAMGGGLGFMLVYGWLVDRAMAAVGLN